MIKKDYSTAEKFFYTPEMYASNTLIEIAMNALNLYNELNSSNPLEITPVKYDI